MPGGRFVEYEPNALGEVRREWTPSGEASPAKVVVERSFWPGGELKSETDPHLYVAGATHASTRSFTYDDAGRMSSATDALGRVTTYGYDAHGNRSLRSVVTDTGATAVEGWVYDGADRLVSHSDAGGHVWSEGYDPVTGRHVSSTDPLGRVETRTFWANGWVRSRSFSGPGLQAAPVEVFYDGGGRRSEMIDATGSTTWTYDGLGNLASFTEGSGRSFSYTWSLGGDQRTVTYPDGAQFRFTHDSVTGGVKTTDAMVSGVWVPLTIYGYDAAGVVSSEVLAGGGTRSWSVDVAGKLDGYSQSIADGTDLSVTRTYRLDGRVGSETVAASAGASVTPYPGQLAKVYGYDNAGQLTSMTVNRDESPVVEDTWGWTYGTRGNRLTETHNAVTTTSGYDVGGRLVSLTGATTATLGWDESGRLTTETYSDGGPAPLVSTTWDNAGRAAVSTSGDTTLWRSFNGDGQLVAIASDTGTADVTMSFTWDNTQAVPQALDYKFAAEGQPEWVVRTNYGLHRLNATSNGGFTDWYAYDASSSAIASPTDVFGDTIVGAPPDYDAFGKPEKPDFAGYGYRAEFQYGPWTHLRARDYRADLGIFTTPDPLDGVPGTTTVANKYHYADNDPINKVDPLGLRPTDDDCTWKRAVVDSYIDPLHDPGSMERPVCRLNPIADEYIRAVTGSAETWDNPTDGFQPCNDAEWSANVTASIEVVSGKRYVRFAVVPSGAARYLARVDGGTAWSSTWACANEALYEIGGEFEPLDEESYRSQYYCHAFGSVGVPFSDEYWAGGPDWGLEGFRRPVFDRQTWIRTQCSF